MSAPDTPSTPSTPSGPGPQAGDRVRGLLATLLRGGRGRSTVLLGLFVLVLFSAGRATPGSPRGAPAPGERTVPETPRIADAGGGDAAATLRPPLPEPTPEAVAVDNLLARYDALIRLLEARSLESQAPRSDSALTELRTMRSMTYAAARRAMIASLSSPRHE